MTISPEAKLDSVQDRPVDFIPERYTFEQLFFVGYVESKPIAVWKNENNDITVTFRTLTPLEIRDILEVSSKFQDDVARSITERIETLARAITTLNHAPLVLTKNEQQEYYEKNRENPSPLTMARMILSNKIKSLELINILYEKFTEFSNQVAKEFEEAKKK
jgi:hypothetical protein